MKQKKLSLFESKYMQILLAMAKTVAASFLPYLFIGYTFAAGMDEVYSKAVTDFLASLSVALLFCFFFHVFYTKKRNKEYSLSLCISEPFDTKKELFRLAREDGIPFLFVYGALAIFEWIFSALFFFFRIRTPISVILWFIFPFQSVGNVTPLQFLSTLAAPFVCLFVIPPVLLFLAVRSRKKIHLRYKSR